MENSSYQHFSEKLARRLSRSKLTTDLSEFIGDEAAATVGLLADIRKFAKKYGLTERAVLRHIYVGDIPCVFIDSHAFVLDYGHEYFHRELGWRLNEDQLAVIEKLLVEQLGGRTEPPKCLRRSKSGHGRKDLEAQWRKNDGSNFADFMKIGYGGSQTDTK